MKKITLTLKMLLFVALLATWSSCSKSDDNEIVGPTPVNPTPNTPDTPTPSEPDDPYMTVCEHVAEVAKQVKTYFKMSDNIGELASHAEEIEKIDYVNEVYCTNSTMYVDIKDFGPIFYSFYSDTEKLPSAKKIVKNMMKKNKRAASSNDEHPLLGLESALIINQLSKDEKMVKERDIASETKKILEECGIQTKIEKNPKKEVFIEDIFDYDIVFLLTHGGWDPKQKVHWMYTSEQPSAKEAEDFAADDLYKYKDIPRDQVSIGTLKEKRNGVDDVPISYVSVSEKYIETSSNSFKKRGKSLFFNIACMSMMGGNDKIHKDVNGNYYYNDSNTRDKSFALTLKGKGLGFYLGYDQSNCVGAVAGLIFFANLASGMSVTNAYENLYSDLRNSDESEEVKINEELSIQINYIADLIPHYSSEYPPIGQSCITRPSLLEYKNNSSDTELQYILEATSPIHFNFNSNYSSKIESYYDWFFLWIDFRYGFELSEYENFNSSKQYKMAFDDEGCPFPDEHNRFTFTKKLTNSDLKSSTTYYYKAFFYDGVDTYYTEPKQFTTKKINSNNSSSGELPNVPGSDL